ncbi:sulfite exporter TauE/SafE family protein [Kytococcus sp. Marseille-QA3725]
MSWLVALGVGVLVGLLMGSLGGGGAIIAIPALIYLVGQSPYEASTSSLVIVALTGLVGVIQHHRGGRVAWGVGLAFGLLGIAGSAAGAYASAVVPERVLMTSFGLLLLVVAVLMWRRARAGGRRAGADDADAPPLLTLRPFSVNASRVVPVLLAATAVGFLTGFFGVGGGFAVVPALTLVLGLPMRRAVGTSLLVIIISSLSALVVRATSGLELDWPLALTFAGAAMAASLVGGRIGQAVSPHRLQAAFAVLLVAVALVTLLETVLA